MKLFSRFLTPSLFVAIDESRRNVDDKITAAYETHLILNLCISMSNFTYLELYLSDSFLIFFFFKSKNVID